MPTQLSMNYLLNPEFAMKKEIISKLEMRWKSPIVNQGLFFFIVEEFLVFWLLR